MASKLNNNLSGSDNITSVISSDKFGEYSPEMQQAILDKLEHGKLLFQRQRDVVEVCRFHNKQWSL